MRIAEGEENKSSRKSERLPSIRRDVHTTLSVILRPLGGYLFHPLRGSRKGNQNARIRNDPVLKPDPRDPLILSQKLNSSSCTAPHGSQIQI